MRIDRPGIYPDMSETDYFADPCPLPSLTQTIAKLLLEASPRHAWHAHPRLNLEWAPNNDPRFDTAHVAHVLILGKGKHLTVSGEWTDYRTQASRLWRDRARSAGKVPVLQKAHDEALQMMVACMEQMQVADVHWSQTGLSECAIVWQDAGTWCRGKLDRLEPDGTIYDYKTTGGSASPAALQYKSAEEGWDIQSAMYETGLVAVKPELGGRVQHIRIVQETSAPYACNITRLDEATLTVGRQKYEMALQIWRQCMLAKKWPTYNEGRIGQVTISEAGLQRWTARYMGMTNPTTLEVKA